LLNLVFAFALRHDAISRPCDVTDGPAGMVAHVNGAVVQRKGSGALGKAGISLRWYRRTGATVIARGMGTDAAATFLGHSSTAITEGHYIEPDRTVDPTPRLTWNERSALTSRTVRCSRWSQPRARTRSCLLTTTIRTRERWPNELSAGPGHSSRWMLPAFLRNA